MGGSTLGMTLRLLLVGGLAGACVWPRAAEACSFIGYAKLLAPATGQEFPAGAGLLIARSGESTLDVFAVTIDGEPATLSIADQWPDSYRAIHRVVLDPVPQPGQTVMVSQCGASLENLDSFGCRPGSEFHTLAELVVVAADTTPPPARGSVSLAHDPDPQTDMCTGDIDVAFEIALSDLDQGEDDTVVYAIDVHHRSGAPTGGLAEVAEASTRSVQRSLRVATGPAEPESECVTVTAIDLSGNEAIAAHACGSEPLAPAEDSGDATSTGAAGSTDDAEPADATSEDGSPARGTTLDEFDDEGSGDPPQASVGERGCACGVTGHAGWSLGWLGLAAVAGRRRRRVGRTVS
jgi:MYXO-CTERM domain-containing protein